MIVCLPIEGGLLLELPAPTQILLASAGRRCLMLSPALHRPGCNRRVELIRQSHMSNRETA